MRCEFLESCYKAQTCELDPEKCSSRLVCLGEIDLSYMFRQRDDREIDRRFLLTELNRRPWDSRHGTSVALDAGCMCYRCRAARSRRKELEGLEQGF